MIQIPETWKKPAKWVFPNVCCTVLGEKEEDTFIVMELCEKVVQYKILLKTLRMLCDLELTHLTFTFQFIASFAGV